MTEHAMDFSALAEKLPPIISRNKVDELLGGMITAKTLANLDSLGEGPPRIRIGRKIGYPAGTFIVWLEGRTEVLK